MNVQEALLTRLKADAPITAALGGRIYPVQIPQHPTYPAMSYTVASVARDYSHDGDTGLVETKIEFMILGKQYSQVRAAGDAIISSLSGFKGTMGTGPGIHVGSCFHADEEDFPVDDLGVLGLRLLFDLAYEEA